MRTEGVDASYLDRPDEPAPLPDDPSSGDSSEDSDWMRVFLYKDISFDSMMYLLLNDFLCPNKLVFVFYDFSIYWLCFVGQKINLKNLPYSQNKLKILLEI